MQIKRFQAPSMSEALRMVKKEFGPEAVILSAVGMNKRKKLFGSSKGSVEVTAATDNYFSIYGRKPMGSSRAGGNDNAGDTRMQKGILLSKKKTVRPMVRSRSMSGNHGNPGADASPQIRTRELFTMYRQMRSQGVDDALALELMARLQHLRLDDPLAAGEDVKPFLADILSRTGAATRSIKLSSGNGKIVAFIGPAGVGKTTTAAKVAALAKYRRRKKSVALISTDSYRITGAAQLEKYADIIGVPFQFASNHDELVGAIDRFKGYDLIVIDTPGVNPRDEQMVEELRQCLDKIIPIELHLLLSAATKEEDLTETIDRFRIVPVNRLIFTKLDETGTFGAVVNQMVRTKIPVSYFSRGHRVPEDIESVTPQKLISMVLTKESREKVWSGAPEQLAEEMDNFKRSLSEAAVEHGLAQPEASVQYDRYGRYNDTGDDMKVAAGY